MVQNQLSARGFLTTPQNRLFYPVEEPLSPFPIQSVHIDWDRLVAKRSTVLDTIDEMPAYLLKPEVLTLLDAAKHPTNRLILDLMWTTGARVSEVLALKPGSFIDDGYDFGVILQTLKQRPGRPTRKALQRSHKRYVPIVEHALQDRIQSYLYDNHFNQSSLGVSNNGHYSFWSALRERNIRCSIASTGTPIANPCAKSTPRLRKRLIWVSSSMHFAVT